MDQKTIDEGKTLGLVAYLTLIGVLVSFFMNQDKKNPFIAFHIRQGFGLWILYFAIGYVVGSFDSWMVTYSFWIFFSVLFIYGIFGAVSGQTNKIPLLGDLFQKIFKPIGE